MRKTSNYKSGPTLVWSQVFQKRRRECVELGRLLRERRVHKTTSIEG
jgi:hypothetical protein